MRGKADLAYELLRIGKWRKGRDDRAVLKPSAEAEMRESTNWGDLLPPNLPASEQAEEAQQ